MHFFWSGRLSARHSPGPSPRLRSAAVTLSLLVAFALPALAQPRPPALPAAPAVPAVPSAPALPAAPSAPALPKPPAGVGSARPAGPEAKAGPDAAPASSGAPGGAPVSAPTNADYVLYERSKKKDEGETTLGVPPSLPPELKRNVKPGAAVQDSRKLLTIEDLTNAPVISASNRLENLRSAPAFVIVLTDKELRDRGYTELSQMLDDLPGMDVVRPSGDVYVKSYWRGYRPGGGADPYLVMVDGIVFNHLFFRDGQILASFPLSNVERVEIAYGPSSAVYGPNAAMGVINVITKDFKKRQEQGELGTWLDSRITVGGAQRNLGSWQDVTRQVDATLTHVTKDYRLRLTARSEDSVLDRSVGRYYEYTKDKYYRDPRLWTDRVLTDYPDLAGQFRSPDHKRAVDGRLFVGNAEVGAQFYSMSTGLGTRYPGDRVQTSTPWTTTELSLFGRHTATLSGSVTLTSLIQYRRSNLDSPSSYLTSTADSGGNAQLNAFEVPSSAVVVQEDLSVFARRNLLIKDDSLVLGLGFKYQHLDLTRNVSSVSQVSFAPGASAPADLTPAGDPVRDGRDRLLVDEVGTYLLAKYSFPAQNAVHAGVRYDRSSLTNVSDVTFRGGYAGTFGPLTAKALYGQAVYAPGAYDLLALDADRRDAVSPERSSTLEANLSFASTHLSVFGDVYKVGYTNPVVTDGTILSRDVAGFDVGATAIFQPLLIWAYYSRYLQTKEERIEESDGLIGDLAFNKVWGGVTLDYSPVTFTVLGRFIGARDTVDTNMVRRVPRYFSLDANLMATRLFYDGLWAAFRVTNILDSRYAHPGMDRADAGVEPAVLSAGGYRGSLGGSSSILPQPGRSFFLTMGLNL